MIESIETMLALAAARGRKNLQPGNGTPTMDLYWRMQGRPDRLAGMASAFAVQAKLNHSRWIAECCFCHNAMLVALTDPRWWCSNAKCRNGGPSGAAGAAIPIEIPAPWDIMRIEALLVLRPAPEARNWEPGTTVAQLVAENADPPVVRGRAMPPIDIGKLPAACQELLSRWRLLFGAEAVAQALARPPEEWMR
jgi:hypothetical protein